MKKQMLTILLIVIGMLISAGTVAAKSKLGKWEGFRGISWATNIKDVNDIVLRNTSDDGRIADYTRTTDKLSIGKAKLTFLVYRCYKDKFYGTAIGTNGSTNFARLKEAVFAYYGEGTQDNEYIKEWTWLHGDVFMLLKYNEFNEESYFGGIYLPIRNEEVQDDKDDAEDAGDDF